LVFYHYHHNNIYDAGIAVSGVIVDGVNDIPTAIVDFLEVSVKIVLENP
jgi:hypothetical protein